MGPNRRIQELERAAAAAARRMRRRRALIRDAMIAIAISCAFVGTWELVAWMASIGVSNPDAKGATGLIEPTPQRSESVAKKPRSAPGLVELERNAPNWVGRM
jgi:nitrate reductase NapE component